LLLQEGKVKTKETIVEGFENTPTAFSGLFTGANTGKMVVKL
jgi:NADPH-dependent curcumin reductase CurA